MKKILITFSAAAVLALGATALPLAALATPLVTNGSFESGTAPGTFITVPAAGTDITAWSVDSGSVDYIGSYWPASDGTRSLDLNGLAAGSVSQTIATVVGASYTVTFDLSGNPDSSGDPSFTSPSLKDVRVTATGGAPQDFTYDTAAHGNTLGSMMWVPKTYTFTATAVSTTLTFASQIAGAFGPAIDNVVVTAATPPCSLDDTTFDTFALGNVNGQHSWSATGPYDQAIVNNTYGYPTFGCKSLRISDATTSGSFGDWIFSPSNTNEAGESAAVSGGFSGGTRQNHFEAQFDLASTLVTLQPGMHLSVSPDRGDGARMSYLRFEDQADGIHVFFIDATDPTHVVDADTFNETDIATVTRAPHTIKFSMDFANGPDNDVVKIYIDGVLKATGTSWEDYYRFDTEQAGGGNQVPTVDSLIFQSRTGSGPVTNPADAGNGFLIDNVSLLSSTVGPPPPPPADACTTGTLPAGYTKVNGTTGNDTVTLAPFTMFIGKGGNDKVTAPAGDYIVCALGGNDTISLGDGNATVDAGDGNNTVTTGNGTGAVKAGGGNDTITTGNGAHTINAGAGNNTIKTGDGDQTVTTAGGNDKITTGTGNDTINAGAGNNTVASGDGTDTVTALGGNDSINGGPGADVCSAGGGTNTLVSCP